MADLMIPRFQAVTAALLLGCAVTATHAAPVAAEDAPAAASKGLERGPLERAEADAAAIPSPTVGHKTIDLLLQLQAEPRQGAASTPGAGRPSVPAATTAVKPDPTPLDHLKDLATTIGVQPRGLGTSDPERDRLAHERRQESGASVAPQLPEWRAQQTLGAASTRSLLDHAAVRFIRENRLLVLGASVALLAAVWGAANFSLRRPRH